MIFRPIFPGTGAVITPVTIGTTKTITINGALCGGVNSMNFPMRFIWADTSLRSVANGGSILSPMGNDIVFFLDPDLTILLPWELISYDPAGGSIIAWINVPNLSGFADTLLYLNYGNPAYAGSFNGTAGGTMWPQYDAVYHLDTFSGAVNLNDSSPSAQPLTISGMVAITSSPADGGAAMPSAGGFLYNGPNALTPTLNADRTLSFWYRLKANVANYIGGFGNTTYSFSNFYMWYDGAGNVGVSRGDVSRTFPRPFDTNWHYLSAMMYGGSGLDGVDIYLDGVQQVPSGGSGYGVLTALGGMDYIALGGIPGAMSPNYHGYIDEFRIATQYLGPTVIAEYNNMNNPNAFYTGNLMNTMSIWQEVNKQWTLLGSGYTQYPAWDKTQRYVVKKDACTYYLVENGILSQITGAIF